MTLCGWPIYCGNCHDSLTNPSVAGSRADRHACRHRWSLPADTGYARSQPLRRHCLRLSQPTSEPPQAPSLGRQRRLALPASPASWALHLANIGCPHLRPHASAMDLADRGYRLAKTLGGTAVTLASLSTLCQYKNQSIALAIAGFHSNKMVKLQHGFSRRTCRI